jgi:predicted esterase
MTSPDLGHVHQFVPGAREDGLTLLLLHGTGGDEHDLLGLGRALSEDAALLSPLGNVLERGARRFFRRRAEGVFDEVDIARRAAELARFVTGAADAYGFDAGKVVAAGFSNGANIAAAVLLHPETLRGAALFAPMVPLVPDPLPDLSGVAAFASAGRADPIAPPHQAERLAQLLASAGAAVTLRWHPGSHTLDGRAVSEARTWLGNLAAGIDAGRPLP